VSFSVTFDQPVVNFDSAADVIITHSGTSHTGVTVSGGPEVYAVDVIGIGGNGSFYVTVSTTSDVRSIYDYPLTSGGQSADVLIDAVPPSVAITSAAPDPTNASPIAMTITFSEPVTGFDATDLAVGNGTVTNFAGTGALYTFDLAPSGQGSVTVDIAGGACADLVGNANAAAAQFSRTYDTLSPTATMSSTASDPTNTSPIAVTVTFSESVTGFGVTDLVIGNGTVNNFAGAGSLYTFDLAASGQGLVTVDIAGGACADLAGNANAAAPHFSRTYDTASPTGTITSTAPDPTNTSPIAVTVTFSEPVTGFDAADLAIGNGAASNFAGADALYTFDLAASGQGLVTVDIAVSACADLAGNPNNAVPQFSRDYDIVEAALSVTSTFTSPTNISPFPITAAFTENMVGFTAGDIIPINSAVSNFAAVTPALYTFDLIPAGQGAVSANIPAGACTDGAGNPNQPGSFGFVYDTQPPVITLIGGAYVRLAQYDLYVDPGATAMDNIDGDVTANLLIDSSNVDTSAIGTYPVMFVAGDAAGNQAAQVTRTVEVVSPTASLPSNPWQAVAAMLAVAVFWGVWQFHARQKQSARD
jgi:hypothetical protein